MFYIIENSKQLDEFCDLNYSEVFIEPIYLDNNLHPLFNGISLLYLKPINVDSKGYIICVDHSESFSVDINYIENLFKNFKYIYVRNAKTFKYHFCLNNIIDISFNMVGDDIMEENYQIYKFFQRYGYVPSINKIIPLVKHFEVCENIFDKIKKYCYVNNKSFNNKRINVFYLIEQSGIKINPSIFNTYFKLDNPHFSINDDFIYTQYNLYNTTGRPSNRFNNINFAALNKDNGCRESFIPSNDKFIEIDIKAYHPTLVSQLVKFDFQNKNPYVYLSEIANIDVNDAKILMFKQLYGGINHEYKDIPFFNLTHNYINELWETYNKQGYIKCDISGDIFDKNLNLSPQKLFNYVLQNLETSTNILIMWDILKLLIDRNSKIVLYTYDSILLDFCKQDEDILSQILDIFKKFNLDIKITNGINYNSMILN